MDRDYYKEHWQKVEQSEKNVRVKKRKKYGWLTAAAAVVVVIALLLLRMR